MQAAYHLQIQELEQQLSREETALLHQFLISLVRLEQAERSDGNLNAVMEIRALRDSLLDNPRFPLPSDANEQSLRTPIERLLQNRQSLIDASHKSLETLNLEFARQIEPVMRELTRAGDFETAREILTVRRMILLNHGVPENAPRPPPQGNLQSSSDPNTLPFSLEPPATTLLPGFTPRRSQIPHTPIAEGAVRFLPKQIQFRGGKLFFPAPALDALVHQVKQNQMFTLELGFQTAQRIQHSGEGQPHIPLFYLGASLRDANLALTHEGADLVLYLRTDRSPPDAPLHRIPLGPVSGGRMEHLAVTYRNSELTLYRDGAETRKLRAQIIGGLESWQPSPLTIGSSATALPDEPDPAWTGDLVFLYLRSSHETARSIGAAYSRFADFVTRPLPSP